MDVFSEAKFLFQGDSITDCDRSYNNDKSLGNGYVMVIARLLSARHPEKHVRFVNRGINGNKINDLKKRWQKDCIDLRPNVITILIGVNDISKVFFWGRTTSDNNFEKDYRNILEQCKSIDAKIVLMEPFIVNVGGNCLKLQEKLFPKIAITRRLAADFDAILIPLSEIFLNAQKAREPAFWSGDGFHPTIEGHELIARSWIAAVDENPSAR